MAVRYYRDLDAWQKSMDLVTEVYRVSKLLPRDEQFGLTNQIRRSAVSVPSNIAEGHARLHKLDYLKHLSIARGSLAELETQLQIAVHVDYLTSNQIRGALALVQETGRLINGLIRSLESTGVSYHGNGRLAEETESYEIDY